MILGKLYLGLELNRDYAMISTCVDDTLGPETVSPVAGSENYRIPVALAKRKVIGQWYYGEDALSYARDREAVLVDDLYFRAMNRETVRVEEEEYSCPELLAMFLGKLLLLTRRLGRDLPVGKLCVVLPELDMNNTSVVREALRKNELLDHQFFLTDAKESFYYYALNQSKELITYDNALFYYANGMLRGVMLSRNTHTTPQVVTLEETNYGMLLEDRDEEFTEIIKTAFAHRIVSAAYITGDGFDGEWMKESLKTLCRSRKAFSGKNLFTRGACFAALVKGGIKAWNYAYIGDNELKINVSVKVRKEGEIAFLPLLSAGESWYEAEGAVEAILDGDPTVDFWLQEPRSREAKIQSVELMDFPERENKTTRLRITAKPVSDEKIKVTVKDLGFGDISRASEMHWEHLIWAN
ncbi:MAG: hypothetical protein II754_03940 [Lachnospiraceae bacterium]|nr:hypothetical protein [Lachnospiraceae bacterium]